MQQQMKKQIEDIFTYLGMNPAAGNIYLTLLTLGESRAAAVAKAAKLNRSVAYGILEDLVNQGFIHKKERSGVQQFFAEHPSVIIQEFTDRTASAQSLFPALTELFLQHGTRGPKVRFYADYDGIRTVYNEILTDNKAKFYYNIGSVLEGTADAIGRKFSDDWHKRRLELGISHRAIRSEGARDAAFRRTWGPMYIGRGKSTLRDYRNAPFNTKIPTVTYMFENKVAFVSARYGQPYAAVIESKDLYDTMVQIFELLWKVSLEPDEPLT